MNDQTKEAETSFKPLTVSSTPSEASTAPVLNEYAATRARLLFGCYRKGDANDPETYVAAITAVLSKYPDDVIGAVTHPAEGLPIRCDFIPTVAEVYKACEERMQPRRAHDARRKAVTKQLAERKEIEATATHPRGSDEAKAVRVVHEMVDRLSAFNTLLKRPDGSVMRWRPMTPQLLAFAKAPPTEEWVVLTYNQAGAWEAYLRILFDERVMRQHMREGSRSPWPWPPSVEGKIYNPDDGTPPGPTQEDIDALAAEGNAKGERC